MTTSTPSLTRLDKATTYVGERLEAAADRIRPDGSERSETNVMNSGEPSSTSPNETVERVDDSTSRAETLASILERAGDYLRNTNDERLADDLRALVREHPERALAIGVGTGFVLGMTLGRGRVSVATIPAIAFRLIKYARNTSPDAEGDLDATDLPPVPSY